MSKDKEAFLNIVLTAASNRADYLDELANECYGYGDTDAAKEYQEESDDIRTAIAELN